MAGVAVHFRFQISSSFRCICWYISSSLCISLFYSFQHNTLSLIYGVILHWHIFIQHTDTVICPFASINNTILHFLYHFASIFPILSTQQTTKKSKKKNHKTTTLIFKPSQHAHTPSPTHPHKHHQHPKYPIAPKPKNVIPTTINRNHQPPQVHHRSTKNPRESATVEPTITVTERELFVRHHLSCRTPAPSPSQRGSSSWGITSAARTPAPPSGLRRRRHSSGKMTPSFARTCGCLVIRRAIPSPAKPTP